MKTKKVLLGSLVLAGMFSACTNEEIVVDVQGTDAMANRAQVDLSLNVGVESRMSNGTGFDINFTKNDLMGAVLVDAGYTADATNATNMTWNNVNWNIVEGHVGNNKWAYNTEKGKFETAGTTAVGAWLFYTKYNEAMTTTRDGVKFHFPQIQDGAANYEKMMNNNINFMVAPIVNVDGYEGETLNFPIEMNSVYNYLNMKFDFSGLTGKNISKVQKIVVSSTTNNAGTAVPFAFPLDYKVVNKNVPVAAMSTKAGAIQGVRVPCLETSPCTLSNLEHQKLEMARKAAQFRYDAYSSTTNQAGDIIVSPEWAKLDAGTNTYKAAIAGVGAATANTLIVDFEAEHGNKEGNGGLDVVEGKVSAYMLMPAGVYENLKFDIYTNDGVYTVTVEDRNAYRANIVAGAGVTVPAQSGLNKIFLRPAKVAVLSDIENAIPSSDLEYIKVVTAINGNTSTKTPDLINYINGINAPGTYELTVVDQAAIGGKPADDATIPVHATVINKAVMDAIVKKEAALNGGDIQLVLDGYTNMNVIGESKEAPLNIHDITFKNGCTVKEGYVKATADLGVAAGKEMLVKDGANVELALTSTTTTLASTSNFYFAGVNVEKGGIVNVTKTSTINNIENKGTFTIEKPNNTAIIVTSDKIVNKGIATLKSKLDVREKFENTHHTVGTTTYYGTFTNDGELTIKENAEGSNNNGCSVNNNGAIYVQDDFTNKGDIIVAATGKIHVNNATRALTSSNPVTLKNEGTITNKGMLYTKVGYLNHIDNVGIIKAESASTTYITTNSLLDETVAGTSEVVNKASVNGQKMGLVKLAERNLDITVTNPNYQGYIQYEVQASDLDNNGKFDSKETPLNQKDKYNKIILKNGAELTAQAAKRVRYIETSKDLVLPKNAAIQEVTFTATATLYSEKATIAYLNIKKNVLVKVPTENVIGIFAVNNSTSKTVATINVEQNAQGQEKGELLVGGDLYTLLSSDAAKANGGEFSAGDGNNTAFHWGENFPSASTTTATE